MGSHRIEEVLAGLDAEIGRAVDQGDAGGYFTVLYRKVTAKVAEGIEAGFFDDGARMERLDALFAERYFEALEARRSGGTPTASWQVAFDAGSRWRPLVLQHLLVGINAHINLDLGIAAARCSPGPQLPALRADFDRINAILAAMIDTVQADLQRISPWMGVLDRIGARTSTELVRFSIVTARAGAWRFATDLDATPATVWEARIDKRDRRVARIGERVLQPGPWMSVGLLLVRMRERSDVVANLDLLRDAAEPSLASVAAELARADEGEER